MRGKLLKMQPIFQDKIWGGDRLNKVFGYTIPTQTTGECWAISGHPGGDCGIEGMDKTLGQLWKESPELFGNLPGDILPLLIKIIDAKDDLSIQVHPDDAYAGVNENGSLGKTECWYVLDCDEGTTIIVGHNAKDKEQMAQMVAQGQWKQLLREIPIHKGDFFQIDPGCLHAIKGGTMILETQQSSDVTYRFYDYDRLQDGKPRPLHIEKSLAVTTAPFVAVAPAQETFVNGEAQVKHLVTCPYYSVYHVQLKGQAHWNWDKPFVNVSILDGQGTLDGVPVRKGDHLLLTADYGPMTVSGQVEFIYSHL